MRLTFFIWHHRKAALTLILILCLLGAYFAGHLPVAIFPQLTVPRIVISADAGDIPIETTLVQITRPLEAAASTVPGVTKVLSTTARGSAGLDVTFADGTDMQQALQHMQGRIGDVRPTLPANANVTAAVVNPSIFPIMGYNLTSSRYSLTELRHTALYTLRPRLARLPGVAQVRVTGGDVPEFLVSVRPEALAERGLTLQDVQDALAKANGISSVGHFEHSYQHYEILVSGLLRDAADIENVTVATKGQIPIPLADLATVRRSVQPTTVIASGNGAGGQPQPAVVINIIKQPDANTVAVAEAVHQTLAALSKTLPAGMSTTLFYDQSEIVKQSESSVIESIVIGGVLALLVLMLFLGNLRAAAIVLLILPLTLLITFSLMKALGQTLNIMTLGALAVALGLVIDDGIVVVENIFHELEQGRSRGAAIGTGLHAIIPAMVGSSLTTMAAFLPLTFLGGVTGQFFGPLAIVMVATLLVSLVLALLLTPILADYFLPQSVGEHNTPPRSRIGRVLAATFGFFPRLFDHVVTFYSRVFGWCLRRPVLVLLLLLPVGIGSYWLFNHLQTGFFPEFDEGAFVIDYRMPAGASLAETSRVSRQVETLLQKTPEVSDWSRLTGALSGSGLELTEQNQGDILVRLKDKRRRSTTDVIAGIRHQLESSQPAMEGDYVQILQDGIGDMAGSPAPIEVKIFGDDTETLSKLADQAGDIVSGTPGVVDENNGVVESGPQMLVRVNSQRASRYGLTTDTVTAAATAALSGSIATTVQQGEEGIDVRVIAAHAPSDIDATTLPSVPIAAPALLGNGGGTAIVTNGTVPLNAVADLSLVPGTPQITRENQQQRVAVTARLEGRDLGSAVKDVQGRLAKNLTLPPGYRIEYGGLYATQQQSFAQLASVLALTVLLVSTLLVIQFRSLRQSFALFTAAVLSLFGVLLGLFVTHTPLNISSFTGAIMIVGIVTENGIVLFDFYNHLKRETPGRSPLEVMADAGRLRLRPILMTTVGAILALLPLALGLGAGAAMQRPLAIAVIGGLSVSTLFTLIVAPVLFVALERLRGPFTQRLTTVEEDCAAIEKELAQE